jgi:ribosome-binding protein aMBF1 (putative translation factor)
VAQRITYFFATGDRIVLLTVFRKQRMNERSEVARAGRAMQRCIDEQHGGGRLMARNSWQDLKGKRLRGMSAAERAEYDRAYDAAQLAAEVGERVRAAREAAGLSQRELAARMGTSQAAIARLEAGGVGATLTTLQRVAAALGLELNVELRSTA